MAGAVLCRSRLERSRTGTRHAVHIAITAHARPAGCSHRARRAPLSRQARGTARGGPFDSAGSGAARGPLEALRDAVVHDGGELFERWRPRIRRRSFAPSALNLAHYVALRRHELRDLQLALMPWGLSSLGRCEARVLENLDAVIATAAALASPGEPSASTVRARRSSSADTSCSGFTPRRRSARAPAGRDVRIMVTLPTDAATSYPLVQDLVARGMDVARINCAHDDADAWAAMADHVRRAGTESGRRVPDLHGHQRSALPDRRRSVIAADPPRLHVGDRLLTAATSASPRSDVARMVRVLDPRGGRAGAARSRRLDRRRQARRGRRAQRSTVARCCASRTRARRASV